MKRRLKPFGKGDTSHNCGYDLPLLLGHLESLAGSESATLRSYNGAKGLRLKLVEQAIDLLNQAYEMSNEEC